MCGCHTHPTGCLEGDHVCSRYLHCVPGGPCLKGECVVVRKEAWFGAGI